jgi:hypothetical protein
MADSAILGCKEILPLDFALVFSAYIDKSLAKRKDVIKAKKKNICLDIFGKIILKS